ncbi:hypothetical protein ACOBMW_02120 [Weissella cibaria]|uniref:hypothetical protein n=1 Tax=Weissella cibaria TaxID=137591 RepID=UPI003CF6CC4E
MSVKEARRTLKRAYSDFQFHLDENEVSRKELAALMSRLWTGFFGTERYRTPKIFQNPDFSLKRRDFWVFL